MSPNKYEQLFLTCVLTEFFVSLLRIKNEKGSYYNFFISYKIQNRNQSKCFIWKFVKIHFSNSRCIMLLIDIGNEC